MSEHGRLDPLFDEIAGFLRHNRTEQTLKAESAEPLSLEPAKRPSRLISKWEEYLTIGSATVLTTSIGAAAVGIFLKNDAVMEVSSYALFASAAVGTPLFIRGIIQAVRYPHRRLYN